MIAMKPNSLHRCLLYAMTMMLAACGASSPNPNTNISGSAAGTPQADASTPAASPPATQNPDTQATAATSNTAEDTATGATQYAQVVSVQPVSEHACIERTVVQQRAHGDRHQIAGTVLGALVGGAIGNKLVHGRGRGIATAGGAVGGGLIGKNIQKEHQRGDTVTRVVKDCPAGNQQDVTFYDVVYAYQGQTFKARLDYDPGNRVALPVHSVIE